MRPNFRVAVCALAAAVASPGTAQEGGGHDGGEGGGGSSGGEAGGSTGHADLFGDLVHVKRVTEPGVTGQPILEMRWVEHPMDARGWRFCPIPLDETGAGIGFAVESCDTLNPLAVVEVDYFGRLSAGRTRERNIRMHFDEVIDTINDPAVYLVTRGAANRLELHSRTIDPLTGETIEAVKVIDSPQENLALYNRVMRYGHLQTNPLEVNDAYHGDPNVGAVFHPALTAGSRAKFDASVADLLPALEGDECMTDPALTPDADPCAPEILTGNDFVHATGFLGGAADKHGRITIDLVQYMNRILKLTTATPEFSATLATLPVLIRTCDVNGVVPVATAPPAEEGEEGGEIVPAPTTYDAGPTTCATYAANDPAFQAIVAAIDVAGWYLTPASFVGMPEQVALLEREVAKEKTKMNERVVDYAAVAYARATWFTKSMPVVMNVGDVGSLTFAYHPSLAMLPYLDYRNPGLAAGNGIQGFVSAASDGLRAVEFAHNYEVPVDFGYRVGFVPPARIPMLPLRK